MTNQTHNARTAPSQPSCNVPPTHAGRWGDAAPAASPSNPTAIQLAPAPGSVPPRSSAGVCPRSYPPIEDMGEATLRLPRDVFAIGLLSGRRAFHE